MTKATNNIEIRVLGLMRSGNHAIIDWLRDLYPNQSICFLNNLRHGDCDPYKNYSEMELSRINRAVDVESLRKMKKDVLIYSYEDKISLERDSIDLISSVFNKNFERNRENYLGYSKYRFDVIIIRDPFNCMASRLALLRKRGGLGGVENLQLIKENWKLVAKNVIYIENNNNCNKMIIKYNRWINDVQYQRHLSERLMGIYAKNSLDRISPIGGGSSFSRTNIERLTLKDLCTKRHMLLRLKPWARFPEYLGRFMAPRNTPSQFITRWKDFADDHEYRQLFVDFELLELSENIFGEIDGTREFVKGVCEKSA